MHGCAFVCGKLCNQKGGIKRSLRKQKDEKSGREGLRTCAESSCSVLPSSACPGPFFVFPEVTPAGCPEGRPSVTYEATHTNKQQTNQRGKTFIQLQLTG